MGHRLLASGRGLLPAHVDAYTVGVLNRQIRDINVGRVAMSHGDTLDA